MYMCVYTFKVSPCTLYSHSNIGQSILSAVIDTQLHPPQRLLWRVWYYRD